MMNDMDGSSLTGILIALLVLISIFGAFAVGFLVGRGDRRDA